MRVRQPFIYLLSLRVEKITFSMRKGILFILMAAAGIVCSCGTGSENKYLTDLSVEYMSEPQGIDVASPRFGWKNASTEYGAKQTAYRLEVAESPENLAAGDCVFDSGKIESGESVGIEYQGSPLKPHTVYAWRVTVWDENNVSHTSEPSEFSTGLMDEGWGEAQWIGSSQPHFSRYRTKFEIGCSMQPAEGAEHAVLLLGYLDSENYVSVDYAVADGKARLVLSHRTDGVDTEDAAFALPFVNTASLYKKHTLNADVKSLDYAKGYMISLSLDGRKLTDQPVVIQPYPLSVWKPYCRFNDIAFCQPEGSAATFSDIIITEDVWNTVLYKDDDEYFEEGTGEVHILPTSETTGAPMLRGTFALDGGKQVSSALLYITARGVYEFYVNGKRCASDHGEYTDYFNPGYTDYRDRIMYNTYNVSEALQAGNNALGIMLGAGWYCDAMGYTTSWADQYGNQLSALAKLVINYTDGTQQVVVSGPDWKVTDNGPITSDSFQNGEDYDARREIDGWADADFDDSQWENVTVWDAPAESVEIQSYIGSPISCSMVLAAQSVSEPEPGVFVYDMGQNMVGVPRINVKGTEGQKITLRYGEMIYPEQVPEDPLPPLTAEDYEANRGRVYNENYRGALSTDHYIMRGLPEGETICPHFTHHGYRYVEIHGLTEALPLEDVEGLVLNSIGEQMSSYETSNPNINKLYSNIVWGQRGNFLSVPTDCPQRDERLGWTGDAQVFARTATYNMNVDPFYSRWIYTLRDAQGDDGNYCDYAPRTGVPPVGADRGNGAMGWADVGIILPWQVYMQYGDIRFIREHYPSMKRYMDYLSQRAVGYLQRGSGYGDWVAVEHTNSALTNTAYWGYDALLMSKMAKALGYEEDAQYYTDLHAQIKKAFNEAFVDSEGRTTNTDKVPPYVEWIAGGADAEHEADTQTSYVVPLQAELFDEVNKPKALQHLAEDIAEHGYTITTGFIGTPYINLVLSENGLTDAAYRLFEQTEFPSWLYPVLQGATTIWERWNSYTIKRGFGMVDMNSFNHYSFGAIEEWMMVHSLGIQRDEAAPGYRHFILQPQAGGTFDYIRGHYDTVYGRIESAWEKTKDGIVYTFRVPANTSASLSLEALGVQNTSELEFLKGGKYASLSESACELPAGEYQIRVK